MGLQEWLDKNNINRFEGESGMDNLERVMNKCGYKETGLKNGSAVEAFLADNPGAIEKLLEFVEEYFDEFVKDDEGEDESDEDEFN